MPRTYTLEEAAAAIRKAPRSVYRYLITGQLRGTKLPHGQGWSIAAEALDEFLIAQGQPPIMPPARAPGHKPWCLCSRCKPGRGRQQGRSGVDVHIFVAPELKTRLAEVCRETGRDLSDIGREALEEWLAAHGGNEKAP